MELFIREKTGPDHDQKAAAACYTFIEETNTWRRTGSLNRARYWFTMTTLGQNKTKPNQTKKQSLKELSSEMSIQNKVHSIRRHTVIFWKNPPVSHAKRAL
jgi:hypothetical protein